MHITLQTDSKILHSFCDYVKRIRSRITVTKDHVDANFEAEGKETVVGSGTNEEAWKHQMDGDVNSSHYVSICNL